MTDSSASGLMDLATELLAAICEERAESKDIKALKALSQTSHFFRILTVPQIFRRQFWGTYASLETIQTTFQSTESTQALLKHCHVAGIGPVGPEGSSEMTNKFVATKTVMNSIFSAMTTVTSLRVLSLQPAAGMPASLKKLCKENPFTLPHVRQLLELVEALKNVETLAHFSKPDCFYDFSDGKWGTGPEFGCKCGAAMDTYWMNFMDEHDPDITPEGQGEYQAIGAELKRKFEGCELFKLATMRVTVGTNRRIDSSLGTYDFEDLYSTTLPLERFHKTIPEAVAHWIEMERQQ